MSSQDFRNRRNSIINNLDNTVFDLKKGSNEATRVREVVGNTRQILDDLDEQFCKRTGLNKVDAAFLFVAIGLQIARQYLFTKFPQRLDDQTAANSIKDHVEEHSNRRHRYYNPSLEEIVSNPVPFDANIGANGALSGGGRMGHRVTAIGHDPVLGLIFGTANIATSTLTTASFASYHICTNANNRDAFKHNAKTDLVLSHTINKLLKNGMEGKVIVATSLIKEIIHLKSDINTKNSLPLPGISAINPKLASDLASYGLDMANILTIGKQATYASMINLLIAMIHRLYFDGSSDMDRKLYEVKTRKILSYSNLIATSTNMAVVAITRDLDLFDLGGLGVTIYRLITDRNFIKQVKEEFIFGSYRNMIMGDSI
ncbi:hypothetical protein [Clostridium tunisiense]|uniref:hypothetical protein n=1 Tax=Clostridium tunisiense TaxID=219748 RepID=UPI00030DABB4|nr:hypothetical protein [Clostridium tunisiense]